MRETGNKRGEKGCEGGKMPSAVGVVLVAHHRGQRMWRVINAVRKRLEITATGEAMDEALPLYLETEKRVEEG